MIIAERAARIVAEAKLADARAEAANAQADLTSTEALIAHLKLAIEKLRRELYGSRSPRGFAGPNLLATILFEKFAQHQPLNRAE